MTIRELTRDDVLQVAGGQSVSVSPNGFPPNGGTVTVTIPLGGAPNTGPNGGTGNGGNDWAREAERLRARNDWLSGGSGNVRHPTHIRQK